ncbi:MAG: [FeFe] hydrogenase, group A [Eggerthellaceae bacterium]|jgi:NADP-reducing hydrogenase subunit HndD
MVTLEIDGITVQARESMTILAAARKAGIEIPTLCYLAGINEVGACRICQVEVEGIDHLVAACNSPVEEGMVVHTDSPRVREARRTNLELILSNHDRRCPTCFRNGNCRLQTLAERMNLHDVRYPTKLNGRPLDVHYPLVRDPDKCITCLRCVSVCANVQASHVWDLAGSGRRTAVLGVAHDRCTFCGQCIMNCPVGALHAVDDVRLVDAAIDDPDKIVIASVAPSARTSWFEDLGLAPELGTTRRMVAALRSLGYDYVFDTDFAADVTIMEEGSELAARLGLIDHDEQENPDLQAAYGDPVPNAPMFTSCCPGWVRFVKANHPRLAQNLSSTKSPQQIFGALAKTYYAELLGVDPSKIFVVSYMPCLAKKKEVTYPGMDSTGTGQDIDAVLTVRELARQLKLHNIDAASLPEQDFDEPLGVATGAGHIFGVTGGVMEAALRTAYFLVAGKNPDPDAFKEVRSVGPDRGWREATFDLPGKQLRIAVASGLSNADALCTAIENGEAAYDFVEIMACPGGCVGGGGQPIRDGKIMAISRGKRLHSIDKNSPLRFSHENPAVIECYRNYLTEPLSPRAEELLHSNHAEWTMPC